MSYTLCNNNMTLQSVFSLDIINEGDFTKLDVLNYKYNTPRVRDVTRRQY
jgi:hypothetical protein